MDGRAEHDRLSGHVAPGATAPAACQHERVLCEATRWRGACRRRLLATRFCTRRDSAAVCITPRYVDGWHDRAAGVGQRGRRWRAMDGPQRGNRSTAMPRLLLLLPFASGREDARRSDAASA